MVGNLLSLRILILSAVSANQMISGIGIGIHLVAGTKISNTNVGTVKERGGLRVPILNGHNPA